MELYGLIGKGISHSFSPDFFNKKFARMGLDAQYRLFDLPRIDDLPALIDENPELVGLNVTIPYKQLVSPYLQNIGNCANFTGSVNTIKIDRRGKKPILTGYNTDIIGFEKSLLALIHGRSQMKALVLGTGGSARAVWYVLRKLGIFFFAVTRTPQKINQLGYHWIDGTTMADYQLIINTTPLGMFPNVETCPDIPYHLLTPNHLLFDLVYNPEETLFLQKGKKQGAQTMGGLKMLEYQAEASWKIWKR